MRNLFLGGFFVGLQVPEILVNKLYGFPRYSDQGDHLVYEGPTLKEFAFSQPYLNPIRDLVRVVKQHLIEG